MKQENKVSSMSKTIQKLKDQISNEKSPNQKVENQAIEDYQKRISNLETKNAKLHVKIDRLNKHI